MSRSAGGLTAQWGARPLLIIGPLVAAGGFVLLAVPTTGGSYWTTFFPGMVTLGLGMGVTVAPLTTAVMGSVEAQHAGVASGVNNAVARAAGLLAVAALGLIVVARFDRVLDGELATMSLPDSVAKIVAAERGKLVAADFSDIGDGPLRTALGVAFARGYVAGFRASMLVCAGLAALGAACAFWMVESKSRSGPSGRLSSGKDSQRRRDPLAAVHDARGHAFANHHADPSRPDLIVPGRFLLSRPRVSMAVPRGLPSKTADR